MDIASTWELNQSLPSLFEDGKTHPLFSENSPEANRLNEVKQRFKSGYDRTLAEKKAKREKAKPQTPPSSN